MTLFRFGVATENNNYEEDVEDKVWMRNENGELVLVGGESHESTEE